MTHMTPTILLFGCCCTILSFLYFLFHSWSFDRFQSLVPTKRRAFKVGITWSLIIANICFTIWLAGLGYMKYHVGFQTIPGLGDVPTPYALWPPAYKNATVPLYYVLAWAFISHIQKASAKLEVLPAAGADSPETCFWAHLVASIRGLTTATWFASTWFKIWVAFSLIGAGSILGVVIPWDSDPQTMELHIFLAATVYSALFTLTSVYVIFSFPPLIRSVRDQGGSQIVINRLHYHRKLTKYRMVSRIIFVVCFMVMSVDGFTPHQDIAHDAFGTDLLMMLGILGLVGSTIISVYMFFPPDQPRAASDTPSLLPDTPDSRPPSFDTTASLHLRSGDPGSLLSGPGLDSKPAAGIHIGVNPPSHNSLGTTVVNALRHAASRDRLRKLERERERDEAYQRDLDRRAERAHQHSLRSIVAPFATPPGSPAARPDNSPALGLGNGTGPGRRSVPDGRPATSRSISDATDSEKGAGAMERGNQYAWSLLADHLRLPETAMGLVGEATEMNPRGWRVAQRAAQDAMIPPNLRPRDEREVLQSPKSTHKPPFPYPFITPPPPLGGGSGSSSNTSLASAPVVHSSPLGPSATIGKKEKRNSPLPLPLSTFRSLPPPMRKPGSRGKDAPPGPQSPNEDDLGRSVREAADRAGA